VIVKVSQLTGMGQQKQQVMRNKSGAAVGAALALLSVSVLRRRRRRHKEEHRAQQTRRRASRSRVRRWAPVLTALGFLFRRHRRRKEDS
jgi:hypothetical protein